MSTHPGPHCLLPPTVFHTTYFHHPPSMSFVSILRIAVLSIALVLSIVLLGLGATLYNKIFDIATDVFVYRPLYIIASSAGTILVIPTLLIVDLLRSGAFTSMIVVELSVLLVLWVLWFVIAGIAKSTFDALYDGSCTLIEYYFSRHSATTCQTISAISPLAFSIAVLLLAYSVFLLICSIIASSRGQKVWLNSVQHTVFFGSAKSKGYSDAGHPSMLNQDRHVTQQPTHPYYPQV